MPFFNEEGKVIGLLANSRATRVLGESMLPGDYIAGDCVLAGFDPESGRTVELPADFELAGDLEVAVAEPMQLGEPCAIRRRHRSITYEWLLGEDAEGERTLAVLTVSHDRAGVSMLSGTRHPSQFTAALGTETEQPGYGGVTIRSFRVFSGLGIDRQEVGRFSAKGLEAFAERALARLREVCEAGDERVLCYFTTDGSTEVVR